MADPIFAIKSFYAPSLKARLSFIPVNKVGLGNLKKGKNCFIIRPRAVVTGCPYMELSANHIHSVNYGGLASDRVNMNVVFIWRLCIAVQGDPLTKKTFEEFSCMFYRTAHSSSTGHWTRHISSTRHQSGHRTIDCSSTGHNSSSDHRTVHNSSTGHSS